MLRERTGEIFSLSCRCVLAAAQERVDSAVARSQRRERALFVIQRRRNGEQLSLVTPWVRPVGLAKRASAFRQSPGSAVRLRLGGPGPQPAWPFPAWARAKHSLRVEGIEQEGGDVVCLPSHARLATSTCDGHVSRSVDLVDDVLIVESGQGPRHELPRRLPLQAQGPGHERTVRVMDSSQLSRDRRSCAWLLYCSS